jgi:hypothetical protein
MDNRSKAGIIISAVCGLLQAFGLFFAVANEWGAWLTGHQTVAILIVSTLIGSFQTFMHKVPVPKPGASLFLFMLIVTFPLMCGCAKLKAYWHNKRVPAFAVWTPNGDCITRDNDGNTTVTVAPVYLPARTY